MNNVQYSAVVLLFIFALSIFPFLPNVVADEWKIYELNVDDQVFKIPYKITNGEVKSIERDPNFFAIIVSIQTDSTNDGVLEITLPRNLIDSKIDHKDDTFMVLADTELVRYKQGYEEPDSSPCFRTLTIQFPAGSRQIEISTTHLMGRPETARSLVVPIYIATDKNNYELDEEISISGCTSLALDGKELFLEILNPEGKIYETTSITPKIDGSFATSLSVEDELAINGTYTARATYAGKSATSSFVVPEFPLFAPIIFATAISMILLMRLMPKLECNLSMTQHI
jgi:hypothetical protein